MEQNTANSSASAQEFVQSTKAAVKDGVDQLREKSEAFTEDARDYMQDQLENMSSRLEDLSQQMKDRAAMMDQHIKTNPYLYLLGAAGIGFFMAKMTSARS